MAGVFSQDRQGGFDDGGLTETRSRSAACCHPCDCEKLIAAPSTDIVTMISALTRCRRTVENGCSRRCRLFVPHRAWIVPRIARTTRRYRFAHSHGANTDILDCERAGSRKSLSMSGVWVLLGLGVLAMIVKTAGWSHGRADRSNLGFVSARWLAEQRLSQSQDHK